MAQRGFLNLGRFFAERRSAPEDPSAYAVPIGTTRIPGVKLYDWRQALQIPTVFRCVDLVTSCVAMLPWNVMKRTPDGSSEKVADNDRIQWLLHSRPNPEMTAFAFKKALLTHSIMQGNGYAEIERNKKGQPENLWLISDPDRCTPGRRTNGRLAYEVKQGGGLEPVIFNPQDIFHARSFSMDGVLGMGLLEYASRTLSTNIAYDKVSEIYFRQGMRTPGFLKMKNVEKGFEGLKTLMEWLRKNALGLNNMELPIPIDKDSEFTPAASNFEQSQFIDLRKLSNLDVCRLIGVPPHLAYDLDKATFSNIEAQDRTYLLYSLLTRIKPLEEEADCKLLSENHGGRYSKMNVNAFARGDMTARSGYYQTMRNAGVFTVNDILRLEDMPTIGKEGDVRVMQQQYQAAPGAGGNQPPKPGDDDPPEPGTETDPPPPPKPANLRNGRDHHA